VELAVHAGRECHPVRTVAVILDRAALDLLINGFQQQQWQ
jgi:hypothetical protein